LCECEYGYGEMHAWVDRFLVGFRPSYASPTGLGCQSVRRGSFVLPATLCEPSLFGFLVEFLVKNHATNQGEAETQHVKM
jgi:hypothetical protein